ncbi:hypothetical protein [Paenibacillus hunanensis]|uniref:Phosphoglycerol transferase MdoB-like AlkP superfamily enzyme n=1 Tax=Paenibacillus hunanensis TaxID=539262 RepID=A0ABU1J3E3_9BACL|nr:hypothetical protein [Paenibacillus hunanensis]MDR6246040.1 phosphoglycerol transferase MdoB-like AlkP superfamily enzyme [Paenibacillus hunanensis]GGJ13671.1 hypothetical protein GCM10008022_23330 [Paenibacillus hunanensis]
MNYVIAAIILYTIIALAYRVFRRPGRYRLENFGMTVSTIVLSLLIQPMTSTLFYAIAIADIVIVVLLLLSMRSNGRRMV